jgi:hypothetical protein
LLLDPTACQEIFDDVLYQMEEVERVHFAGWQRSLSLEWRDWERKMEEWKRNQTRSRKKGEDSAEAIEFDQSTPEPDTPKYVQTEQTEHLYNIQCSEICTLSSEK